jgi:microcystin degradation protein MlrC
LSERALRIFTAAFETETNTFSPLPTGSRPSSATGTRSSRASLHPRNRRARFAIGNFAPLARRIIYLAAPGALQFDTGKIAYTKRD